MGLRDKLLDEDCNRCEGDVPEVKKLPKPPKEPNFLDGGGEADIIENQHTTALAELKELLGD